tara:strand:+ start:477 stop:836 length:360 start_codon:yes stop_codon:yes gene_type:complete
MIRKLFTILKEIIKVITQYPVFETAFKMFLISRKLEKSLKNNILAGNILHIAKSAINDIQQSKDIQFAVKKLNDDENMYKELKIVKKGDVLNLSIGSNEMSYDLKTKKPDWYKIGKFMK